MSSDLVFITSEDDRYLVKGGIGTAVGIMVKAIREIDPSRRIDWITESPVQDSFVERDGAISRHYVSRHGPAGRKTLSDFATVISRYLADLVAARRIEDPEQGLIIEAADWEGLAADFFSAADAPDILRVSRLHTPLAVCAELNRLTLTEENTRQMTRERWQLLNSDVLSSPTAWILHRTLDQVLQGEPGPPSRSIIPNGAKLTDQGRPKADRRESLSSLQRLTGLTLPDSAFHVFVLGSLEIRKGSEIIQRSIPSLFDAIPACHLTWIGHCAASGELTANSKVDAATFYAAIPAQWHDRVHLTGFIDHAMLPDVLGAADLYALCYLGDNFPGAVLEVALAGVPMAVLMRGGIPEMVVEAGQPLAYALLDTAEESVEDQLVNAAVHVHANPGVAKSLALRLQSHIARRFAAPHVARGMLTTYERELRRKVTAAYERRPAPDGRDGCNRPNTPDETPLARARHSGSTDSITELKQHEP